MSILHKTFNFFALVQSSSQFIYIKFMDATELDDGTLGIRNEIIRKRPKADREILAIFFG
jgi:hypothetical protein